MLSLTRVRTLPALVAAALLLPLVWTAPASAEDVEPPDPEPPTVTCPQFDGPPRADDELTAHRYALACGVDVEVTTLRDVDREVYATPAGTLDAKIAVEPYQVQDATGAWVPIDPTLVAASGGSFTSAATVIDITVGAGGDAPFLTATDPDGGVLAMRWPGGGLPAPTVSGSVATYAEVLPGVDLAVQAEGVGFSWVLVVKTPEAAADPALASIAVDITTSGLSVTKNPGTGHIEVRDTDGDLVFEAGQAIMWDSSAAGAAAVATTAETTTDPGMIADVDVQLTTSGIDLVPDAAMLADANAVYPVYIDPPFTSSRKSWANVYAGRPNQGWTGDSSWPRSGGMRVGYNTWYDCGDGCGLWRSVITLDIGKLRGKYIASAAVKVLQTHTGGCGAYGLQLWRTEKTTNGVSWNDVKWMYGSQLETQSPPSSNTTGGCGSGNSHEWVAYDGGNVKKRVQSAADQDYDTISFGFQSSSEGDRNAWRRLKTDSVRLEVVYYVYPPKPDKLQIDGTSCRTTQASALWIPSRTPTIQVRARSYESESVYVRMRVRKVGSADNFWYYRTPGTVGSYSTVPRMVSTSIPDGQYTWQARTDSRHTDAVNSGYTDPCYFKVDATKPTVPAVTGPTGPINAGTTVTMTVSSSDPTVNGIGSGLRGFEYSWDNEEFGEEKMSTGTSTVSLAAVTAGRHVLYIRSLDKAGNESDTKKYTFFAGSSIPATTMGAWRLGGDGADDSGHVNDLVLASGTGPVFAESPAGSGERALKLDGRTCLTTTAPVDTDGAFTVSLRLRMDAKPAEHAKVLTQGGTDKSVYQVQYSTAENKWYFSMLSTTGAWYSVGAVNPVALGTWLHITGTYDPDAGISRIYFNGVLAAERTVDFTPWNARSTFGVGCLRGASGATGHFFTGAIENLGVWAGLRSAYDIKYMTRLDAGEIGRWQMRRDGDDSTRFGRDLTLPASAQLSFDPFGRPDGALVLDGRSCATGPSIVPADEQFGISAWVKPTVLENGYQVLLAQADADGDGFGLAINPDGEWFYGSAALLAQASGATALAGEDSVIGPLGGGSYLPPTGEWQHVALQSNGTSWSLLVNGDFHEPAGHSGGLVSGKAGVSTGPLTIGCGKPGAAFQNYFAGMIHDVRVWRGYKDAGEVGHLFANPPAELQGRWRLEGKDAAARGRDTSGKGHDLTLEGSSSANDGYACDEDSALEFAGGGSAATTGPAIATDESFTVSAWVRMDTVTTTMTFASAAGTQNTGFRLQYNATEKRFQFVMTSGDVPSTTTGFAWHIARGGPEPVIDMWYHLVGVYDMRADRLDLYVSGTLAASGKGPVNPWRADGPFVIGANAIAGTRSQRVDGAVDDVLVWQSVVPARIIAQISGTPIVKC